MNSKNDPGSFIKKESHHYHPYQPHPSTIQNSPDNNPNYEDERVCPIPKLLHKADTTLPSLSETLPEFFPRYTGISRRNSNMEMYNINRDMLPPFSEIDRNFQIGKGHSQPFKMEVDSIFSMEEGKKPRPRRKYEEVQRLYFCIYPGCNKSYGALNHLNSHIVTKGHGKKRLPQEFEEMRRKLKLQTMEMEEARNQPQRGLNEYNPYYSKSA